MPALFTMTSSGPSRCSTSLRNDSKLTRSYIERKAGRSPADALGGDTSACCIEVADRDQGTSLCECVGRGQPDPAGAPGDRDHFPAQVEVRRAGAHFASPACLRRNSTSTPNTSSKEAPPS